MASSLANRFEALVFLAVLGILYIIFFGSHGGGVSLDAGGKARAKNDVVQIATAITAFQTEYDRLPGTNAGSVSGQLVETLLGQNKTNNPRQIFFIEIQDFKKNGRSGLRDGTFVDPWGVPYQIAFDTDNDGTVTAGTNNVVVPKRVAVWNDPRLEKVEQGWFFLKKPKSRYVTSWE